MRALRTALMFLLIVCSMPVYFSCRCGSDAGDGGGYVGPPGNILMIHPYANPSDVSVIRQGFSTTASCPWLRAHNGVDIFTQKDRAIIQAVAQGEVEEVQLVQFPPTNWWQVNLRIRYNETYAVGYAFEILTDQKSYGDAQYDNITRVHGITIGEIVQQGRILGELLVPYVLSYRETLIHLGLYMNNQAICPDPFFTPDAKNLITAKLNSYFAPTSCLMCY